MKFRVIDSLSKYKPLACIGALLCSFGSAHADPFQSFDIERDGFLKMRIIPTHLMDNETLFLAADAERDTNINMAQRLINNRWLLDEKQHSYSGGAALRNYFKMLILERWQYQRQQKEPEQTDIYSPLLRPETSSQFSDISNYYLRVSDDKVRIRFRYAFD